jgi:signal transduction histidine kinase
MVGKTLHEIFPKKAADHQLAVIQEAIRDDKRFEFENVSRVRDQHRWYRTIIQPVHDGSGQVAYALLNAMDIHALKMAQEELQELNRSLEERVLERTSELQETNLALEKASRAKDEFMSAMSHELRTPLTGILSLSEVMELGSYGGLNERQNRAIRLIHDSGKRLQEIIDNVINFTLLQSGKFDIYPAECSLDEVCKKALHEVEGLASQKKQQLEYTIHPAEIRLTVDSRRIRQALSHILNNAIKFTAEGGKIMLTVNGQADQQQVRLMVRDTGIGIKEEDLPRLFQPFVQLDARLSREHEGTGLGLALTGGLVNLHGGSLEVESVFGEGSCFTILLPWHG